MPFRFSTPGFTLFSLVAAGIMSLFRAPKKHIRTSRPSQPPCVSRVQEIVNTHSDCTVEVFNIFVKGRRSVRIFSDITPGDRVGLHLHGSTVTVTVGTARVATAVLPESSRLPEVIHGGHSFEAYLGGRDEQNVSEEADFASIIVFYILDGVPPTRVNLCHT